MDFPGPAAGPTTRFCAWHQGASDTARLVRVTAASSSSRGASLYACADCRSKHHLTPLDGLTVSELYAQMTDAVRLILEGA